MKIPLKIPISKAMCTCLSKNANKILNKGGRKTSQEFIKRKNQRLNSKVIKIIDLRKESKLNTVVFFSYLKSS